MVRSTHRSGRGLLAAPATFALVVVLAAPSHGAGLPPGGTFVDDDGNVHEPMIEAVAAAGITLGCDPGDARRFCPAATVTRGQMAAFLTRALQLTSGPDHFSDDDGSVHEASINAVAAAGITLGCDPGDARRFCPAATVTRGQMAAFLTRGLNLPLPAQTDTFSDDYPPHEAAVEALAAAGITSGCSPLDPQLYCPDAPVRRDQMATFLGRALDLEPVTVPRRLTPAEHMQADVATLMGFGPRVAGSDAEAAAAAWVHEQMAAITGAAGSEVVPLPTGRVSGNTWSMIGDGEISILIGGHIDSVAGSPGADDNASGIAVILELARNLAADPPADLTVTLVGFGAEEVLPGLSADDHHFGSRAMAARLTGEASLPDYMLSVDMVGMGAGLWAVTYLDADPAAADLLADAGAAVGIPVIRAERGDISDHEAFARQGVPSAFLWRPDNPAWHTPGDTTVRASALEEDLAVLLAWLDEVRSAEAPPPDAQ